MTHFNSKPKINLAGKRFGRLTVIEWVVGGAMEWFCVCDCGTMCVVRGKNLRLEKAKSCGCLKREMMANGLASKHGMHMTRTYKSWNAMVSRCNCKGDKSFHRYGAKGIKVCDRWREFKNFYEDMGERPAGTSIDRWPNASGNYEPSNCRWATPQQQSSNISTNRLFSYLGKEMTAREISNASGVEYELLRNRLCRLSWSVSLAISEPKKIKIEHREAA